MKTKTIVLTGLAVAIALGVFGLVVARRQAARQFELQRLKALQDAELERTTNPGRLPAAADVRPVPRGKPDLQDPLARDALKLVGVDAQAEAYWAQSINNSNLSAKERQDLIEDLNEEGFPDPKNLTSDDLPLILSRLEIIEIYAPNALDDVNARAFMEAHKDLVNMLGRLTQR